jgi:hypothetical protein
MRTLSPNGQPASGTQQANPAASAASGQIGSAGCVLYRVSLFNLNAASRWLQFFDADALPADGVVPILVVPVGAGAFVNLDFGVHGKAFGNGCFWCTSSTPNTKTLGTADARVEASFKGQQA